MKKLVIANPGYDFLKENLEFLNKNPNTLYILSNYSLIENARNELLNRNEVINDELIQSIDDIAKKYRDQNKIYLNKNESILILQKILRNFEIRKNLKIKLSDNDGFVKEILEIFENLKANKISLKKFKNSSKLDSELFQIWEILEEYEEFLSANDLKDNVDEFLDASIYIENNDFEIENVIIYGFIDFRNQELEIIKSISKKVENIFVQYPFLLKSENLKLKKIRKIFCDLDYEIVEENDSDSENKKLAQNIFSNFDSKIDANINLVIAKNKNYEIKKIFELINAYLEEVQYEDISIIASKDYYENIKIQAQEQNIPVSMMNEISIKNISIVQNLINFLKVLQKDDKDKMLLFLKSKIFNEFEIDVKNLEFELRKMEYDGIEKEYFGISDEFRNFLESFRFLKEDLLKDFLNNFKKYLESLNLEAKFIDSYKIHGDLNILKNSFQGLKLIKDYLEKSIIFSKILNLSSEEELDLFIEYLENENYYETKDSAGIKVLNPINAIGLNSKIRFICGLNSDFPEKVYENYLSDYKIKKIYEKLKIKTDDRYEKFDNEVLKFASNLACSDKITLSYVYKFSEEKMESSVLLKNILSFIDEENIKEYYATNVLDFHFEGSGDYYRGIGDIFNRKSYSDAVTFNSAQKIKNLTQNYYEEIFNGNKKILQDKENLDRIKKLPVLNSYSYNMLNCYKNCAFQFYMKYILNFEPIQMDFEDEYNLDKGKFYHEILRIFYLENPDFYLKTEEEIEIILKDIMNATEMEFFNENKELLEKIYFSNIFKLLLSDKEEILKRNELFVPKFLEEKYFASVGEIKLNGRIDRIDMENSGKIIITDYKTKNLPTKKSVYKLENLQLLIYALLTGKERVEDLRYLNIEEQKSIYIFEKNSEEEKRKLIEACKFEIINIDNSIKNGEFKPSPLNKNACKYCDFSDICRIEERENFEI